MIAAPTRVVAAVERAAAPAPTADAAPLVVLTVLTWAISAGAAVTPAGAAGLEVLAPMPAAGHHPRAEHLPPEVHAALATGWPAVRAALDAARETLPERDCYGWPSVAPALLTLVAWADAVRAGLDADAAEWWEERAAIYEADAGFPRWYAESQAAEDLVRSRLTLSHRSTYAAK
jgi:hypothetical protein